MKNFFSLSAAKQAAIHVAAAVAGYAVGVACTSGPEHAATFGSVSGWWAAVYVGFALAVSTQAIPWLIVLFEAALLADVALGLRLFYEEGAGGAPGSYVLLSQIGLIIFVSPVVLNWVVRYALKKRIAAA